MSSVTSATECFVPWIASVNGSQASEGERVLHFHKHSLPFWAGLLINLTPIGELVFVDFKVQFGHAGLKLLLGVGDALVVDAGSNFRKQEREQGACGDVPDRLFHVLAEVPLNGGDGLQSVFFAEFNGHGERLLLCS